jgi:hypothetical protein
VKSVAGFAFRRSHFCGVFEISSDVLVVPHCRANVQIKSGSRCVS